VVTGRRGIVDAVGAMRTCRDARAHKAMYFSRSSQEELLYGCIHLEEVLGTMSWTREVSYGLER